MTNNVLQFSDIVTLEDNTEMTLNYYLLHRIGTNMEGTVYGIQIVKKHMDYTESETVDGISYSEEFTIELIKILHTNLVTPCTMVEILDDLITIQESA